VPQLFVTVPQLAPAGHDVKSGGHAQVPPLHVVPAEQALVVLVRHPFASAVHVRYPVVPTHVAPAAEQFGSLLQRHDADPAAPVHTWLGPHATVVVG